MNRRIGCLIAAAAGAVAVLPPGGRDVLFAQAQGGGTQPATQSGAQPSATQPATLPANGGANGPATRPANGAKISMNFQEASIEAVLNHLSEAAGFSVIKEGTIPGKITIISRQPVSADEAVVLLNSVLKTQGFTAIQQQRILKVVKRDVA